MDVLAAPAAHLRSLPRFAQLRLQIEADAYDMLLRAFHLGAQRLQTGGPVRREAAREAFWASRRMAPLVALAYRRNLALRLSPAGRPRAEAGAPAWVADGLRRACAGQFQVLRALLAPDDAQARLLQVEAFAAALWDAAKSQWHDAASARAFLRVTLPGLRDLLAVACTRYRKALQHPGRAAADAAAAAETGAPPADAVARRATGRPRSVDLFCGEHNTQALWTAHSLAEHFARARGLQVHLYLPRGSIFGDVFRLFDNPEDLPHGLSLRALHSFGGHPPGDIAIALGQAELPPGYIQHRHRSGSRPWAYRLQPLGVDGSPLVTSPGGFYEVPLPQGFAPLGHVKPHANLRGMRQRLHGLPALFARYLQGAGGLRPPLPGEITVYADLANPSDLHPWLQAWRDGSQRVRVLVPALVGAASSASTLEAARRGAGDTTAAALTVSTPHLASCQQGDPILACCDLVLTDDETVTVRSLAAGVPLLAPLCSAANTLFGLGATHAAALAWNRRAFEPGMRLLDEILLDWVARQDLRPAWQDLLVALPLLDQFAGDLSTRFGAAPHVGDCALAMA